jgi:5-methylcytosine-specific restriction endonuclease McrA
MGRLKNIIGLKINRLLVLSKSDIKTKFGNQIYNCLCDCGKNCQIIGSSILSEKVKSCGCYRTELNRKMAMYKRLYKSTIIARSKKLKLEYNISLMQFIELIESECFYCGNKHSNYYTDRLKKEDNLIIYFNGIDRIDNNQGYLIENVVSCCKYCNSAKNNLTETQFKELIINLYENFVLANKDLSL